LLGTLYGQPTFQTALIVCADTYAVQHPGTPNPQATQSVIIHLLNIYGYLVDRRPVLVPQKTFSERAFHAIAPPSQRAPFWLDPPSFAATRTVFDLPLAGTAAAIELSAQAWATSVWMAWSAHHVQIAEWYATYAR
jgi:hypothetical protein